MLTGSQKVQMWRIETKKRIIEALGGKCCVCGYNKCSWALSCHHLKYKGKKEFAISCVIADPISWKKIVKEIQKCILLCHNCHSELHAGLIDEDKIIPIVIADKYINYKEIERAMAKKNMMEPCPVCGKSKPISLITCSPQCAARNRYKLDWDKINLREELKVKSIQQIADELGCSWELVKKHIVSENIQMVLNKHNRLVLIQR